MSSPEERKDGSKGLKEGQIQLSHVIFCITASVRNTRIQRWCPELACNALTPSVVCWSEQQIQVLQSVQRTGSDLKWTVKLLGAIRSRFWFLLMVFYTLHLTLNGFIKESVSRWRTLLNVFWTVELFYTWGQGQTTFKENVTADKWLRVPVGFN